MIPVPQTRVTPDMLWSARQLSRALGTRWTEQKDDPQRKRVSRLWERASKRLTTLQELFEQSPGPSAAELGLRCPTIPRFAGDKVGCGSTDISGPESDGTYDCNNCGLFFTAEAAERVTPTAPTLPPLYAQSGAPLE